MYKVAEGHFICEYFPEVVLCVRLAVGLIMYKQFNEIRNYTLYQVVI